jgi:hypothetical protein
VDSTAGPVAGLAERMAGFAAQRTLTPDTEPGK